MKKIAIITLLVIFSSTSCTDLDLVPNNELLDNIVFTDESSYTSYLAKLYGSMILTGQQGPAGDTDLTIIPDEGFNSYIRAYWKAQELTTDEAVIRWQDAGIQDLNTMTWSSENQFVRVLYYRIFYTISLCNDFLRISTESKLSENGISPDFRPTIDTYRAEARFVRALAYWHAFDLYRNIPIITAITSDLPVQSTPQEIFDFILTELNEIEPELPDARQGVYGHADRGAVWMLRAKLMLNSEVYLGTAYAGAMDQVIADVDNILAAGYSLKANYLENFMADNHTSDEIIFSLNSDGTSSQGWGGTTFMVHGMLFTTQESTMEADYGVSAAWSGVRATEQFVEVFETSPNVLDASDTRQIFYTDGGNRTKDIADILEETHGYGVPKYSNINSDGSQGSDLTFVDTDFPMFRLADAHLMYAEATLRGGNGSASTALQLVNDLRERAFGDASRNLTAGELTLDFILDERSRELYYEAHRRIDLIRFGQFTGSSRVWNWKGNDPAGTGVSDHLRIFPIPATDLNSNPRLVQNDGY